ncbi:inner centromere protein, partial [Paraphysoderma sedebokerense]
DSEDERSRSNPASKIPSWAQSPYLRSALLDQGGTNPDDIFGNVQPLMLEDIFPNKEKRFRVRSSSANWSGVDALTRDEQNRYREYLGYKTQDNNIGGKGE